MDGKYLKHVYEDRKKIGVFITILIFFFTTGTVAPSDSPRDMTVYVAGDGGGDFNCDGIDDQIEINKALAYVAENPEFTTVYLKGPNTYVISDSIFIGGNTTLKGDPTAVVKLEDKADWPHQKPLITQMNSSGSRNITITGFEIDGNYEGNIEKKRGDGYYNLIHFFKCDNISIYNMYMHDSHGDGLKIKDSKNIKFHDNRIYKLGHDGLYAIECQNIEAWNNNIRCKTNSALRIWNSNHVKFHDNTIYTEFEDDAGGPGIQIQYIRASRAQPMNDIEVYNNTIYDTYGPGIWLIAFGEPYAKNEAQNVHIHHNIFYGCGTHRTYDWLGGIVTSGFYDTLIENNVFDGNYNAAVVYTYPTGPRYNIDFTPEGTDGNYTTIVRNNIITNTLKRKYSPEGTGYGIIDNFPETHNFVLENNCVYKNKGGSYKNAISESDIHENPLFADRKNHDYHLKSSAGRWNGKAWVNDRVSSPCIDAGYPSSDYSNEPEDNGDRINIGRYGNTEYASISPAATEYEFQRKQTVLTAWRVFKTIMRGFLLILP
ncbi:right-handed parallel beta-helix repeat-containing protein [Methanosarcina hadiensis]|uniref:right-handed parallel beta-helix repeat-containing protein n=1 Tax=Methanosarcina hadiensis TaxID=3078083 RepID=UPI003977B37F